MDKIKVMIVDDHPLVRKAIRHILETQPDIEIIAEAGDAETAIKVAGEMSPRVVIMDIGLPKLSGIEATCAIKKRWPHIAILALTVYDDIEHVIAILEAGAAGYLTKRILGDEIVYSVHNIVSGARVLSPEITDLLLARMSKNSKDGPLKAKNKLSYRDSEILKLAAKGMSNKEIADYANLSIRTVKGYLVDIFSKLEVASRTEAVVKGLELGIFSLDEIKKV